MIHLFVKYHHFDIDFDWYLLQGQLKEFESLREKMVGNIRKRFERLQGEGAAPSTHSQHITYLEKINKDLSQVSI